MEMSKVVRKEHDKIWERKKKKKKKCLKGKCINPDYKYGKGMKMKKMDEWMEGGGGKK